MMEAQAQHKHSIAVAPAWINRYVTLLQRFGWAVLLLWIAIVGAGLFGVVKTFGNLKLQIEPIPGDANDLALKALFAAFPSAARQQLTLVELRTASGQNITGRADARVAVDRLSLFAEPYIASGFLSRDSGASFFKLNDQGLGPFAAPLLSSSASAVAIHFFTTEGFAVTERFSKFLTALRKEVEATVAASGGALIGKDTGQLPISYDSSSAITIDIGISDSITVSLSFLILALALRSLRLILLTFICLIASFGGAFLLAWPLTTALSTPNFVTSLMISTLISLSLDYSLFLLSYAKEVLARGEAMPVAVASMLTSPGHTVVVSGCTLAACFLVLAIFPVSIIRAPGIAATFAVVMSVLSTLSLIPALLLLFPNFFNPSARVSPEALATPGEPDLEARPGDVSDASGVAKGERAVAAEDVPRRCIPKQTTDRAEAHAAAMSERVWAGIAYITRRFSLPVTVVLLALLVGPFAYRLPRFRDGLSQSLRNIAPRGEDSVETFYGLQSRFSPAQLNNARLIGVSNSPSVAPLSPKFFASAAAAVLATVGASGPGELRATDVSGLAWSNGQAANASQMAAAVSAVAACPGFSGAACRAACPADACLLRLTAAQTLSAEGLAMLLRVNLQIDRSSPEGIAWANRVRAALSSANAADPSVRWHLLVDAAPDSVVFIYENFGTLVGITVAVIFAILAAAFQSAAISLRSLVSLAAMEICVFGAATGIYVDGVLRDSPGVLETFSPDTGLFWLMPLLAFSLTAGLGLDYDIFLMTAIVEERHAGYSDEDAVTLGLQRSGPVISWAGVIMAVAYSGFLFSHIPLLNQLGFFVVFAVLLDSFLVRPLLVPSMMYLLGSAAYWPRTGRPVTRAITHQDDEAATEEQDAQRQGDEKM